MTETKSHKDLRVWHKAMELVTVIYQLTKGLPKTEQYGLTSQFSALQCRCPRTLQREMDVDSQGLRSLYRVSSRGSASEVETLLIIAS